MGGLPEVCSTELVRMVSFDVVCIEPMKLFLISSHFKDLFSILRFNMTSIFSVPPELNWAASDHIMFELFNWPWPTPWVPAHGTAARCLRVEDAKRGALAEG